MLKKWLKYLRLHPHLRVHEKKENSQMTPAPIQPITSDGGNSTVTLVTELVALFLQVFPVVFNLFNHASTPVPVTAAPALLSALQGTPGFTENHKVVVANAVQTAASVTVPKS